MKFRLSLSDEGRAAVEEYLAARGIETGDDGEYMITENAGRARFLNVRSADGDSERLSADEIVFIEAFGKDVEVHTPDGICYARDRMYRLEEILDPDEFIRISKSVIISRRHVKKIRPALSMKYVLTMSDGQLVDVTRSYYGAFRRFFNI